MTGKLLRDKDNKRGGGVSKGIESVFFQTHLIVPRMLQEGKVTLNGVNPLTLLRDETRVLILLSTVVEWRVLDRDLALKWMQMNADELSRAWMTTTRSR